jgi:hypothetical protein
LKMGGGREKGWRGREEWRELITHSRVDIVKLKGLGATIRTAFTPNNSARGANPNHTHRAHVVKQYERCLHDPRVLVTDAPSEVILQVADHSRRQGVEVIHCHHCLLANKLSGGESSLRLTHCKANLHRGGGGANMKLCSATADHRLSEP